MNKGSIYKQVTVIDYSFQGMGVIKLDNFTIFVPFVQIGEVIDIEITELKKNFGFGRALNYESKPTSCKHYYSCGSCNLMHLEYGEQIGLKQKTLLNLMHKNLIYADLKYFCSTDNRMNYRNKVAMPVHYIDGRLKLGYYRRNSHSLIPIDDCRLAAKDLNQLIRPVEQAINQINEMAYNYKTGRGNLRHVVFRGDSNNIMIIFTTRTGKLNDEQTIVDSLKQIPNISSIVINTQTAKNRNILGPKNRVIYGEQQIELELYGLKFMVTPNAFFQVNQEMTNNIFQYISQTIDVTDKVLLDAFCGTGTIGLALASLCRNVVGIEIDHSAVASAKSNMQRLGISNINFICDDIEQAITTIDTSQFDIAIVDPPRSGLASNMKQAIINMQLKELVYISCEPSTLMRDIGELAVVYEVVSIKGFDMFPNTNHIETVAHLKLRTE